MNEIQQRELNKQLFNAVLQDDIDQVRQLIEGGADVNKGNNGGLTPLHSAAIYGQEGAMRTLIRKGAKVNRGDSNESTPLHFAAIKGQEGVVDLLIKNGADVNKGNNEGTVPLNHAIENSHTGITELIINHIVELEAAGLHVSERNVQLKAQVMPEIKKRIFLHNYAPLVKALPQLGYHGDNVPDGVRAFLEENRDRFKVRLGVHEKSLIDFVDFEATVRHIPRLQLCIAVSEVVKNNAPSRNLNTQILSNFEHLPGLLN